MSLGFKRLILWFRKEQCRKMILELGGRRVNMTIPRVILNLRTRGNLPPLPHITSRRTD